MLRDLGLAEGRIFDRAALDSAEQELKRQYLSRGKYAAEVQTTVTPLERNRVAISFAVTEGEVAKIQGINIVGGQKLTAPRRYAWTRRLNWNTDPARGEVVDRTDLDQAYSDLLDQDYR